MATTNFKSFRAATSSSQDLPALLGGGLAGKFGGGGAGGSSTTAPAPASALAAVSSTGRRQHRSCDQCRKGKRACDAIAPPTTVSAVKRAQTGKNAAVVDIGKT